MTEERYKIIFSGDLVGDTHADEAIAHLIEHFGLQEGMARRLVLDGQSHTFKTDLDAATAERYRAALYRAGLAVRVEPTVAKVERLDLAPLGETAAERPDQDASHCPACGSPRMDKGICLDCGIVRDKYLARGASAQGEQGGGSRQESAGANPYAAPRADLRPEPASGGMTGPRRVPAGHGLAWIARGFWHFKTNPWVWMLAGLVMVGTTLLASLIPLVGWLVPNILAPMFTGGLMLGAREQDLGRDMRPEHIFAGFGEHGGQLALVGLLYTAGAFLIALLIVVIMAVAAVPMVAVGDPQLLAGADPEQMMQTMGPAMLIGILVGSLLFVPLVMALLFAPALVTMDGLGAAAAMKLSFAGCLKTWLPFLIYGLIGLVMVMLGALPFGLGLLVVGPILTAAIYVAYRDVYHG
jgi:uncharacterized membrane protein